MAVSLQWRCRLGCWAQTRIRARTLSCAFAHRMTGSKTGCLGQSLSRHLIESNRARCHSRRWQAPILTPFCFLDRRVLVCSTSKRADYISGGLKRPLVFQEGGLRLFPQCVEIFKTLAPLQENITCGSVCGKEEPVCQPSVAAGPAGKLDRVTYLGFPCATTLGTALGQQEIQIASGGSP